MSTGPVRTDKTNPRVIATGLAVVVVVSLLAVVAWSLSRARSTEQIAGDAQTALFAQTVLGSNQVSLKSLGQAVLIAEDYALGVADETVLAAATDEAHRAVDELEAIVVGFDDLAILTAAVDVVSLSRETLDAVEARDPSSAADLLRGSTRTAFESLRDVALEQRDAAADRLVSATGRSGAAGRIASFLVAFLIPAGAILMYRSSARRQLRVAEARLDERLVAERKVAHSKDEFIANISHELRTPLTSIYGFSELLLEEGILNPGTERDLVQLINTESSELARMVEDLLVSARAAESKMVYDIEPVDAIAEIDAVVEPLMRLGANIELDTMPGHVRADRLRFRQIIRNLVVNAHKYGGSDIKVTTGVDGEGFSCVVADNGEGVPGELVHKLFRRFIHEGTDPLTTGSVGLGLSVVKVLANDMGGDVTYRRDLGWTEFIVTMPLADPPSDAAPAAPALEEAVRL